MSDITVYHNTMSASSQKLRRALAEKRLAWRGEEIDLPTGGQRAPAYRSSRVTSRAPPAPEPLVGVYSIT